MSSVSYKSKKHVYFAAAGYVISLLLSAVLNAPIVASLGFLMVAIVAIVELWIMRNHALPYPGLSGKMESWYGRSYVTALFFIIGVILLFIAFWSVYKNIKEFLE